jgi:very-short-patch-repair endonuclease
MSRRRVHSKRLDRPFRGVRSVAAPTTVLELCRAYVPKMAPHEFFSHTTGAVTHGIRLPLDLERRMRLDVAVVKPHRAPRDARVQGHHLIDRPGLVVLRKGMRVANAVETLCQLATVLHDDDLVVAAETLLPPRRSSSIVMLDRIVRAFSDDARPMSRRLARVAKRIRIGSRSAEETRFRLLLVASGLPEPLINHLWTGPDGGTTEGDLVYLEERVWIEIEGDQHRTDKRQWRKDVVRYERLTDFEWRVIRVTADDQRARAEETVERVRRALARTR